MAREVVSKREDKGTRVEIGLWRDLSQLKLNPKWDDTMSLSTVIQILYDYAMQDEKKFQDFHTWWSRQKHLLEETEEEAYVRVKRAEADRAYVKINKK